MKDSNFNLVWVNHWNGFVVQGIVTGGNANGIFVQEPNRLPVFCDFVNVKEMRFNAAV